MAVSLSGSVSSLQSSLQLLESATDTLDAGVSDFPRLCKVLQTTRHFELLPEPTLRDAQKALLDEITPSISHLLGVASNHIDRLARREEALKAKCALQEGRLGHGSRLSTTSREGLGGGNGSRSRSSANPAQERRALELRKLRQKKERLQFTVDRLELQSQQRQRQLRKSMAVQ